jgi:hypothetical protein
MGACYIENADDYAGDEDGFPEDEADPFTKMSNIE